jgi:hypothetical protein
LWICHLAPDAHCPISVRLKAWIKLFKKNSIGPTTSVYLREKRQLSFNLHAPTHETYVLSVLDWNDYM